MRAVLAGVLALALGGAALAQTVADNPAMKAATAWLQLVDAGQYAQSWAEGGALFRKSVTPDAWSKTGAQVRSSLGTLVSRTPRDVKEMHQLPGAPDGDYAIVEFDAVYSKAAPVETVILANEAGAWKVDGYFVR